MQSLFERFAVALKAAPSSRIVLVTFILCAAPYTDATAAEATGKRGVLVLTNGRVVSGRIDQNAGGFIVRSQNGNVQVPFDRVRVRAADLHGAYRRMLASFPNPSPQTHVALANWCMTQQMYDETKIELRSALKLNPTNAEARNMLRRLEEILSPSNAAADKGGNGRQTTADGFEPPPTSSLSGISREAAIEFVTRVQPLMMNSCALAGCHASGGLTQLQLARVRSGPRSSRALTEQNLAATLRYIDRSDADGSPLITMPRGNHGRGGRPVLAGPRGTDHYELLRNWIRRVVADNPEKAKKKNQDSRSHANRTSGVSRSDQNFTLQPGRRKPKPSAIARGLAESTGTSVARRRPANSPKRAVPSGTAKTKRSGDFTGGDSLLQEILRQERRDAFDPAEFNRQNERDRR